MTHYGHKFGVRTWIEIDKKAIKNNFNIFREFISSKTALMAIVKSNAYGHGLIEFAKEMEKLGADFLGADSIIEAIHLSQSGIKKPILVLGYTMPGRIHEAQENNISLTVSSFEALKPIVAFKSGDPISGRASGRSIKIHIKVDTGMHRQGFLPDDMKKVCEILKKNPGIVFEGIYTHFAMAKNPSFPQETNKQIGEFEKALKIVESFGFKPIRHASATSGTLLYPVAHYDMVRIGIGLYGLWPSKEVQRVFTTRLKLEPVLSWKTIIGEVKSLPAGGGVGYDLTEKLPKNSKIAVCPIGYWHGFGRVFSSVGNVLVKGERAKVLGRVSMDMITIDISRIKNVKVGDEVVLIGRQAGKYLPAGRQEITADELAYLSDGVNYEIVTRTNPLIKRVYI